MAAGQKNESQPHPIINTSPITAIKLMLTEPAVNQIQGFPALNHVFIELNLCSGITSSCICRADVGEQIQQWC